MNQANLSLNRNRPPAQILMRPFIPGMPMLRLWDGWSRMTPTKDAMPSMFRKTVELSGVR